MAPLPKPAMFLVNCCANPLPANMLPRTHSIRSLVALAAIACAPAVHAQSPVAGSFVTMRGNDTVAVEQYAREGSVMTGDYVTRPGGTTVNHFVLQFGATGLPSKLTLTQRRGDGTPIPNGPKTVVMTVGDDEAVVVIQRDTAITRRFKVHDAIPLLGTSFALLEVAFTRMRAAHRDSATFPGLPLNSPVLPDPIQVRFIGADSARLWSESGPLYLSVDQSGRISGVNGLLTDTKIHGKRVSPFDITKLIAGFGAADAAGRGIQP